MGAYIFSFVLLVLTGISYAQNKSAVDWTKYTRSSDQDLLDWKRSGFIKKLEEKGFIDRSMKGAYRYALPLMDIGNDGSKLMFTYAKHLPDTPGAKGFVLFAKIRLD